MPGVSLFYTTATATVHLITLCFATDKNPDRKEEAEARFIEVQAAYDVLSDKHERSWSGLQSALLRAHCEQSLAVPFSRHL